MKIQYKILFFVGMQIIIIITLLGAMTLQIGKDLIQNEARREILDDFTTFVQATTEKMSNGNNKALTAITRKFLSNPNVVYFVTHDTDWNVINSQRKGEGLEFITKQPKLKPRVERELDEIGFAIYNLYSMDNVLLTEMIQEIHYEGETKAIVRLGINEANTQQLLQKFTKIAIEKFVYFNVWILIASFLTTFLFVKWLVQPINKFQQKISTTLNHGKNVSDSRTTLENIADKFEVIMKEVNNSQKQKLEFATTLSHEFSTPLQAIIGYTDYLRKGYAGEINEEVDKILAIIKDNSLKFESFINDIRDLMNIETNKLNLNIEKVDILPIIKNIVDLLKIHLDKKNINVIIETDANEIPYCFCDAEKTHRVLVNLLSNAIKFTQEKGEIIIKIEVKKKHIQICIKDNGIGIDEKELDNIFVKFYQVENKNINNNGLGIGLSISKAIVEQQSGEIWVKSKPNKGTSVFFTIPI